MGMSTIELTTRTAELAADALAREGARLGTRDDAPPRILIPSDAAFDREADDFLDAPAIDALARELIERYSELSHLRRLRLRFCWKRKGGTTQGKARLGKCVKSSGLAKHYSETDFVIWLAADHCREYHLTTEQLEALTYHELCHAGESEPDDNGVTMPKVIGHDVEAFASELERYGCWHEDLVAGKQAFDEVQLDLPGF